MSRGVFLDTRYLYMVIFLTWNVITRHMTYHILGVFNMRFFLFESHTSCHHMGNSSYASSHCMTVFSHSNFPHIRFIVRWEFLHTEPYHRMKVWRTYTIYHFVGIIITASIHHTIKLHMQVIITYGSFLIGKFSSQSNVSRMWVIIIRKEFSHICLHMVILSLLSHGNLSRDILSHGDFPTCDFPPRPLTCEFLSHGILLHVSYRKGFFSHGPGVTRISFSRINTRI